MGKNEILEQALHLKADDRFLLIEELLKSLDKPDENINKIWEEEANRRVDLHKDGKLETVSEKDFFDYEY
jgi:putative addiction module component (TIGR02574 family)